MLHHGITQILLSASHESLCCPPTNPKKNSVYFSFSTCFIVSPHQQFFIRVCCEKMQHKFSVAYNIKHFSCPCSLSKLGSAVGSAKGYQEAIETFLTAMVEAQKREPKWKNILSFCCPQSTLYHSMIFHLLKQVTWPNLKSKTKAVHSIHYG